MTERVNCVKVAGLECTCPLKLDVRNASNLPPLIGRVRDSLVNEPQPLIQRTIQNLEEVERLTRLRITANIERCIH